MLSQPMRDDDRQLEIVGSGNLSGNSSGNIGRTKGGRGF